MTEKKFWEKANILIGVGIATEDEIILVAKINGYNEETVNDILYVRTGYRDLDQFLDDTL